MSTQTSRQTNSILVALALCMALQMTGFVIFCRCLPGASKVLGPAWQPSE